MRQENLFNEQCEMSNNTSDSDADLTVNTSTEETGQTPTKNCTKCGEDHPEEGWYPSHWKGRSSVCKVCFLADQQHRNAINNKNTMYVNGKYVPKSHPLWKAGKYKSFDDAAFSSLVNYESSTEGQVYIITNSAWPEWVKIGMAVDANDRCNGYQTSSPFRDYKVMYAASTKDRRNAEAAAHKAAEKIAERRGEWFKMSVAQAKECIQHGL